MHHAYVTASHPAGRAPQGNMYVGPTFQSVTYGSLTGWKACTTHIRRPARWGEATLAGFSFDERDLPTTVPWADAGAAVLVPHPA